VQERAKRRFEQIKRSGKNPDYSEILSAISKRDYADTNRDNCPLRRSREAIVYDSTGVSFEKVVKDLLKIISSCFGQ
jgi:cytidylate kinase